MTRIFGSALVLLIGFAVPAYAQRQTIFPQFATGSGWTSELFFANQGLSPTSVSANFYTQSGAPLTIESNLGTGSVLQLDLGAGATQVITITPQDCHAAPRERPANLSLPQSEGTV